MHITVSIATVAADLACLARTPRDLTAKSEKRIAMSQPSYGGSHGGGASSSGAGPSSMSANSTSSSDDKVRRPPCVSRPPALAPSANARARARVPQNLHQLDAVEAATLIRLNGFQRTLKHAVKIQDIPVIVTLVRAIESGAGRGYPSLFACTRGAPLHRALYF